MKLTKKDKVVYTLIIILGILAFIVSTVLLMRTEKAEAATTTNGTYYPDLLADVPLGDLQEQVQTMVANNKYIVITKIGETYYYVLSSNVLSAGKSSGNYKIGTAGVCPIKFSLSSGVSILAGGSSVILMDSGSNYVIGSNYDYRNGWKTELSSCPYNNLDYPTPAPVYSYSSTGPYAYFPNIYLSDNKAVFDVKGEVVSDFMEMDVVFNIKLPARAYNGKSLGQYFKDLLNNPSAGSGTYDIKKNLQFFPAVPVKLERVPLEKNEKTGEWRISWSFPELFEVLETLIDEPLHTRYGITENEMESIIGKWILAQSYCETIETVIYNKDVTNSVWITGPLAISRYGLDGILTLGYKVEKDSSEVLTSDKINAENNALQDMLQGKDSEIEDLKTQINHISDYGLVGMDNWNETSVWKTFKSLSSGLLDIGPAFLSISSTVGCVFAFLPGEIQGVIYFGFLAFIVIAIIKVLRG